MKIDFHSHVKISKKSSFMPDYFRQMITEAKEAGLDAIAMTEHFNTKRFMDIYHFLDQHYPYEFDYYNVDGCKIFPGIEVDVKEVGHILLIGRREDILSIHHALEPHKQEEQFVAYDELLNLAEQFQLLKIGAHPFRKSTPLTHLTSAQLQRLDALDLNGKDLHSQGVEPYWTLLKSFADNLELPIVGGSDTHQFLQYGCITNKFQQDCRTIEELLSCIQSGQYDVVVSNDLHLKVKAASLVKKFMKELLEEDSTTTIYL